MSDVAARIQQEVTEIAQGLAREQGKPIRDVWQEALTLHRVRYERESLSFSQAGGVMQGTVHPACQHAKR